MTSSVTSSLHTCWDIFRQSVTFYTSCVVFFLFSFFLFCSALSRRRIREKLSKCLSAAALRRLSCRTALFFYSFIYLFKNNETGYSVFLLVLICRSVCLEGGGGGGNIWILSGSLFTLLPRSYRRSDMIILLYKTATVNVMFRYSSRSYRGLLLEKAAANKVFVL